MNPAEAEELLRLADLAPGVVSNLVGLKCGPGPVGMFRLTLREGGPVVLKLVPPERWDSIVRAEKIAAWLADRNVPTPRPLAGYPRRLPDGRGIALATHVEGRRIEPREGDMEALGRGLGLLHRWLGEHPDLPYWERATVARLDELGEMRAKLADGTLACGPDPARLAALAGDARLDFALAHLPARPLHGDLNPGNVLMADGRAVLLDFEDVFHSVLPSAFELALVIERHVLVPIKDDSRAISLARVFMETYRGTIGAPFDLGASWPGILRSLALRSLCVLSIGATLGRQVSNGEWSKFFTLEQMARKREGVMTIVAKDADGE